MSEDPQDSRSEEAKRAAFAARHEAEAKARAAARRASPSSPPSSPAPDQRLLRRAMRYARRLVTRAYRGGGRLVRPLRERAKTSVARTSSKAGAGARPGPGEGAFANSEGVQSGLRVAQTEGLRIAIKVPATNHEVKETWGDYHFAVALQGCFQRAGHAARIDVLCDWDTPQSADDDVVLVLRGLCRYAPKGDHINLMWNISHPDKISDEEFEAYDHVFVASMPHARALDARLAVPVTPLMQCTDPERFFPDEDATVPASEVLFVGNSRRQHRPAVMDAIAAQLPLTVYGGQWSGIIDARYVAGEHVPNQLVRKYYSRAKVVLNDHWPSMRDSGFVSNRLFDAAACGATLVSDPALGIEEIFGDAVRTYATVEELREIVQDVLRDPEAARARAHTCAARVREVHSFERRAEVILDTALRLSAKRP